MSLVTVLTVTTTTAYSITESIQITNNSNDIPTWYINDYWTYNVNPIIYTSPNGSFTGTISNLKQQVSAITTIDHHGTNIDAYELTITGTINGDLTYEGITGDLQGTLAGKSYVRQADLAEITTNFISTGTITIVFIQQPYTLTFHSEFQPTFELYDFPLYTEEHWNTTTYSTNSGSFQIGDFINDTFATNTWINETITCPTEETITVPAGTYTTYKINHGSTNVWYAPDIGNIIKTHISQTTSNTSLEMTLNLIDHYLNTPDISLIAEINPDPAILNQTVSITGIALDSNNQPISGADIILTIPATEEQYTSKTNTSGEYNITITTPYITDNTPTTYDLGSDGIHLEISQNKEIDTYILTTLIVRDNTAPSKPSITGKSQGKPNIQYTYIFQSLDPENDPIYLQVDWGDTTQSIWQGPYLSGEEISLTHTWTQKDTYIIRAQTKDINNAESEWTTLEIQIPHTYIHQRPLFSLLHQILQSFQR